MVTQGEDEGVCVVYCNRTSRTRYITLTAVVQVTPKNRLFSVSRYAFCFIHIDVRHSFPDVFTRDYNVDCSGLARLVPLPACGGRRRGGHAVQVAARGATVDW